MKQTNINLPDRRKDLLISFVKLGANDCISFFERKRFIKDLSNYKEIEGIMRIAINVLQLTF
jgi:hypothetical protein